MRHVLHRVALLLIAVAALPAVAQRPEKREKPEPAIPADVFAGEPRGPYATGTLETFWVDAARDEPRTLDPDDRRRLPVQIWYPATVADDAAKAPYLLHPERYIVETRAADHGEPDKDWRGQLGWLRKVRHVRTNSVVEAALPAGGGRYPVLVYNHGGGNPHFTATFHTEFLASHGYVVVAVGHPGFNGVIRQPFPDGYTFIDHAQSPRGKSDAAFDASEKAATANLSSRERFDRMFSDGSTARNVLDGVRDVSFVLDELARLDADPGSRFHKRLDLDHAGAMGWSMGGVVSLQASLDEPRIKAAINEDGWPYGLLGANGVVPKGSPRPVMVMNGVPAIAEAMRGPVDASLREEYASADTHFWTMFARSRADWYWLRIEGADHGHFSDHPLFSRGNDTPGAIHPRLAHTIVNDYALAFFDKHLRGRDAPLLSNGHAYRDASLMWKGEPRPADDED
ncbi:alpha/beta hydrolase family protein [Luteimonas sp. RIT-PG2_3]